MNASFHTLRRCAAKSAGIWLALLVSLGAVLLPVMPQGGDLSPSGGEATHLAQAAMLLPGAPLSEPESEREARPEGPERDVLASWLHGDGTPAGRTRFAAACDAAPSVEDGRTTERYKVLCTYRL